MKKKAILLSLGAACLANAAPQLWLAPWIIRLAAVAFYPDGKTGCVLGSLPSYAYVNEVFRCTSDGGTSWRDVFKPKGEIAVAGGIIILSPDGAHGWVLIGRGIERGQALLRTQDGARTWTELSLTSLGGLYDLQFASDGLHGMATGMYGVFHSEDGGTTWNRADLGPGYVIFPRALLNPNGRDVVVDAPDGDPRKGPRYRISSDGGATWHSPGPREKAPSMRAPGTVDYRWDNVSHAVERSADGKVWEAVSQLNPDWRPENFFTRDGRDVWVCGYHGLVLHSGDGGVTWVPVYQPPEWSELAFRTTYTGDNGSTFWAAGESGFVVRTTDGGATWSGVRVSGEKPQLFAIRFLPDNLHGWVAGDRALLRTEDGGATWRPCEPGAEIASASLRTVTFDAVGVRGWAGGEKGIILLTEDGGAHWTRSDVQARDKSDMIRAITAPGAAKALAFSGSEALISSDSGKSWRPLADGDGVTGPPGGAYAGWSDSRSGASCVLASGVVYCSRDGGVTWSEAKARFIDGEKPRPFTWPRTSQIALDPSGRNGIAHATEGIWLRSADGGRHWFEVGLPPRCECAPAVSGDGTVWGAGTGGMIFRLTTEDPDQPTVSKFAVGDDRKPEIQAAGTALKASDFGHFTHGGPLRGYIDVRGRGVELLNGQEERGFSMNEAEKIEPWNREVFHDNEDYFFDLFVFDGWNIASATASKRFSSTGPAQREVTEIDLTDFDFTGASAPIDEIDGKPLASEAVTRGETGRPGTISKRVADTVVEGLHAITVAGMRALLYKDETTLALFHPFDHSYAVIVAVGDYPAASQFGKLRSSVDQAKKLRTELEQSGFEVIDALYDAQATRSGIEALLTDKVLKKVTPRDRLVIYFGGHGTNRTGADGKQLGYFIPYDGRLDNLDATTIDLFDIQKYARILPAKHILFALDSCQAGFAIRDGPTLTPAELNRFKTVTQITGYTRERTRLILTAGTGAQKAADDNGGIFTDKLMEAIRGGPGVDLDNNGVVDQWELCKYLADTVPLAATKFGLVQEPGCRNMDDLGNGKWIFATTPEIRVLLGGR